MAERARAAGPSCRQASSGGSKSCRQTCRSAGSRPRAEVAEAGSAAVKSGMRDLRSRLLLSGGFGRGGVRGFMRQPLCPQPFGLGGCRGLLPLDDLKRSHGRGVGLLFPGRSLNRRLHHAVPFKRKKAGQARPSPANERGASTSVVTAPVRSITRTEGSRPCSCRSACPGRRRS